MKTIMQRKTLITSQTSHSRMTMTLTRISMTYFRLRSHWITIAPATSSSDVSKAILALGTGATNIFVFAATLSRLRIAFLAQGSIWIAITG